MDYFFRLFLSLALSTSSLGFAKENGATARATPRDAVNMAKMSGSVGNLVTLMSAFNPQFNVKAWYALAQDKGLDLQKLTCQDFSVSGNEVTVPGFKPFTFTNDFKFITYDKVRVALDYKQAPQINFARMQKAWGSFKEFSMPHSASLLGFILPAAHADVDAGKAVAVGGAGVFVTLLALAGYADAGLAGIGATLLTGGAFAAAVGIGIAILVGANYISDVLAKTSNLTDVVLECGTPPRLINKLTKNSITLSGFTESEREKAQVSLAKICAEGPESQKKFNDGMAIMKTKIADGSYVPPAHAAGMGGGSSSETNK
jgi:hypothetical protein